MPDTPSIDLNQSFNLNVLCNSLPRLAIAVGDPAGIGPEIVLKAIANSALCTAAEITLVGSSAALKQTLKYLSTTTGLALDFNQIPVIEAKEIALDLDVIQPGKPNRTSGHAGFCWLNRAITGALEGKFDAVVTAPIAKSVWHTAGHHYPGQTEVLAERAKVSQFGMMFAARSPYTDWPLRCLLATTHIPLNQVPTALTPEVMDRKLSLLVDCLRQDFGIAAPNIAIAGLNPHSGEAGKLGTEEETWLIPWLVSARERYPQVRLIGPIPPDTMWVSAGHAWHSDAQASPFNAYLALYHDQGLIPVKLLAFDRAVNMTIGLPFVRTSPDHGTAFDIAGQGIARADSMEAAIELAITLVQHRKKLSLV
ncbi:MAG: 4-hydroxythreonine-4-phosphate dehydrogenase PdxA [Cyanobacteria bacterium P01_F01_bin.56]